MRNVQNFIDGRWQDPVQGRWFDVIDPATGDTLAKAARSDAADAARAVAAAANAFDDGRWAARPERDRSRVLLQLADAIRREREALARLESLDSGKPYADALADIDESAYLFEYYAGWATKLGGEIPPVGPRALSLVLREPVGVVAAITPWNYPLLMASQKVAPALAAGCSVVVKPAEQTPLTTARMVQLAVEAGVPAGVLSLVNGYGPEAGEPLVRSDAVDMVSFTGSLDVGRHIQAVAADTVKRVALELGGKSPNIVLADADLEKAVAGTCYGVFWNQGEVCSAGSRVFVQRTIWDRFMEGVEANVRQIHLGRGIDPDVNMGPLISGEHLAKVEAMVATGFAEGARAAVRGTKPKDPALSRGFFHEPLVLTDVHPAMEVMREEIFGPVMAVMPFDSVEEVVKLANATPYGLAAAVWTRDIVGALAMARRLRAGTVWINDSQPAPSEAPWGGYKQSGVGRELGRQGLEEYLEVKHVYVNLT